MIKEEKKEQILEAAKDVLLKKGIFKTRVEDITNHLGIAKGSFYTYFKSKDELVEEIVTRFFEIQEEELREIISSSHDCGEKIKLFLTKGFKISSKNLKTHLILINLTRNLEHLTFVLRDKLLKIQLLYKNFLQDLIKEIPDNNYSDEEIKTLTIFILGGIKTYKFEKLFYKNMDDFFISDTDELRIRLSSIDLEKEVELITDSIIKLLMGGK